MTTAIRSKFAVAMASRVIKWRSALLMSSVTASKCIEGLASGHAVYRGTQVACGRTRRLLVIALGENKPEPVGKTPKQSHNAVSIPRQRMMERDIQAMARPGPPELAPGESGGPAARGRSLERLLSSVLRTC